MPASEDLTPTPPAPHLGPVVDDGRRRRDRLDGPETAIVLSHYELGVVERIREFRRGSRRAPKLRISSERGEFLLKRRAPGRDDPYRVAFAQDLQLYLQQRGYPVPGLVGTRRDNNSMLQLHGRIYELFRYIRGDRDDRSQSAAHQAGDALGRLHHLLADYRPSYTPPTRSYHAASAVDEALKKIPESVIAAEPGVDAAPLEPCCEYLLGSYHEAAQRADAAGLGAWPPRVLHGDWHPGNLLYRRGRVAAVLDFDSARMEPRMIDIANAALQFSMSAAPPDDPESWPDRLEVKRIRALIGGYDRAAEKPISDEEKRTLPWLVIEALVLESVIPIAATGRFGRVSGAAFLRMVERKIRWIRPRAEKLLAFLET